MSELYQVCIRTNRARPIKWNAGAELFDNAEKEETVEATSRGNAAESYVERYLMRGDLSDRFEYYGGEHRGERAVVETWVREYPKGGYTEGEWQRFDVFVKPIIKYLYTT